MKFVGASRTGDGAAQGKVLAEGDMQSVQANPKVKEVYLGH